MVQHIKILGLVLNLVLTACTITYLYLKARDYRHPSLLPLAHYSGLMGIASVLLFLYAYADMNLPAGFLQQNQALWQRYGDLFLSLLVIGLLVSMARIVLGLLGKGLPRPVGWGVAGFTLLLAAGYLVQPAFPDHPSYFGWLHFIRDYIIENILLLEPALLIFLLLRARPLPNRSQRRMLRAFSLLYLGRYLAILAVFGLAVLSILPEVVRAILGFSLLASFNLMPVFWLQTFFLPFAKRFSMVPDFKGLLETFKREYGISPREAEVLELVLKGRSNKEIEDLLCISFHTVKNHIYNLFQKTGASSRYELMNLVTRLVK